MKIWLAIGLLISSSPLMAKSWGVVGEVYPVAEQSFLEFIQARLKTLTESGEIEAVNTQWQQQVVNHANRPVAIHLPHAKMKRTFFYRPEIVVDNDIEDYSGRVLIAKGTVANALTQLPTYSPCWLFFNADEQSELRWAIKIIHECANPKIILTGGAIADAETALNSTIYFDQGEVITQKLGIHATPARVTRKGNALKIEELVL